MYAAGHCCEWYEILTGLEIQLIGADLALGSQLRARDELVLVCASNNNRELGCRFESMRNWRG
jgi:hypothetical protein